MPDDVDARFRLLFVCTGNICRSAAAERLARAGFASRMGPGAPVEVTSAGTYGLAGEPMDSETAAALRAVGGDPADFVARRLTAELAGGVDLVLALTRAHRGPVVSLVPVLMRRTFTLREFDRLSAQVDLGRLPRRASGVARMRAVVDEAASLRGMSAPPAPTDDDVADPYRAPPDVHQATVRQIAEALVRPLDALSAAYTRR
jgi:protein-tyrosine phosphatase